MMIPPKGEWTEFRDEADRESHYKSWGLSILTPIIFYNGFYTQKPVPCEVLGYQDEWAVIAVAGELHRIFGEYLAETQPKREKYEGMPREYVVFDLETTSQYTRYARIVEIAAAKYKDGEKVDCFESLVKPKRPIPKSATKLHGIADDDVTDAPMWESVQAMFFDFIEDLPLVGHNVANYDIPIVMYQSQRWFDNLYIDTLQRVRKAFPKLKSYKLEYLKERLGLSSGISHRAMSDVDTTNALLWACENPEKYRERLTKE